MASLPMSLCSEPGLANSGCDFGWLASRVDANLEMGAVRPADDDDGAVKKPVASRTRFEVEGGAAAGGIAGTGKSDFQLQQFPQAQGGRPN